MEAIKQMSFMLARKLDDEESSTKHAWARVGETTSQANTNNYFPKTNEALKK